ncbi:MAG: hypothetical protein WBE11_11315 [Candidatus Aminicenantaceae bacterium]
MWIQFLVLFLTPFYWFTTFFFRRIRLTTIGDYFNERFNSKSLGASYAIFIPLMSILGGGVGYMVTAKTMMGGFRAVAITDTIQGVLIIIFSLILIPLGLSKIGGFSGLHATVPDYMFELFGSVTMSEYAWYTILAMVLANLVSIIAVAPGMQTAGSAKDEMTARFGMITGMFFKRFIMIFWALAGLIAIGLYAGMIYDPDLIWGFMTKDLLIPGAIGLMLVGILAANMSRLDASAVSYSALFIKNLYEPFRPKRLRRKRKKNSRNHTKIPIGSKRKSSFPSRIGKSKNRL